MAQLQRHLFICTHERDGSQGRSCCSSRGSSAVASAFKEKLHARGLKRIVRANKAGCLDQCERGVTCVVYPEAVWYGGVTESDVDEIIESHIVGGKPVARLRIADEELTGINPQEEN